LMYVYCYDIATANFAFSVSDWPRIYPF